MSLLEDRTASFIVRIWREQGEYPSAAAEWRGSIEHVQSGHRAFFRTLEAIFDVMKPHLAEIGIDPAQRFWEAISPAMDSEPPGAADGGRPVELVDAEAKAPRRR